jgi:nucleoid-associated protein YgaU
LDELKKYFSESTLSLILGVLVVVVLGAVAYKVFKGQTASVPQLTPQPASKEEQTEAKPGELTAPAAAVSLPTQHQVKAGETLWSIAQKYYTSGYNWVDIAEANNLPNPNKILTGQKLVIPAVAVRQPVAVAEQAKVKPTVTPTVITGEKYTVVKGDNLWKIALRAYGDGFRWKEIASANKLVNPRRIHAGNVLVIPRP